MRIPLGLRTHLFDCTRFGDADEWVRLVDVVWDVLASGRSVFVHCAAGIHRAPVVASGILSALLGISFAEAYESVASARYVEPSRVVEHLGSEGVRASLEAVERVAVAVRGAAVSSTAAEEASEEVVGDDVCGERVASHDSGAQCVARGSECESLVVEVWEKGEADDVAVVDAVPGVSVEVVAAARARGLSFDGGVVLGAGAYGVVRRGVWADSGRLAR